MSPSDNGGTVQIACLALAFGVSVGNKLKGV
jgi:hypothetical protein